MSVQSFLTCSSTKCGKTQRLASPQPSWVLELPIQGNTSLDAALEAYFFATEFEAGCSSCKVPGLECARLCRLPTTLLIHIKRAVGVSPMIYPSVSVSVWCLYDVLRSSQNGDLVWVRTRLSPLLSNSAPIAAHLSTDMSFNTEVSQCSVLPPTALELLPTSNLVELFSLTCTGCTFHIPVHSSHQRNNYTCSSTADTVTSIGAHSAINL